MKRVTVTIPDDLEGELDRFVSEQLAPPSVTSVLQASLKRFLTHDADAVRPSLMDRILRCRGQIVNAAQRRGVTKIRIFGSVARGEARPDSDIDVLVTASPGTGLFDLADLRFELEELLGAPVHLSTDGGMTEAQRDSVLAEAITL